VIREKNKNNVSKTISNMAGFDTLFFTGMHMEKIHACQSNYSIYDLQITVSG
jgi:hypothetical protein